MKNSRQCLTISKNLESRQKYSAARRLFPLSSRCLEMCSNRLSFVFDILHQNSGWRVSLIADEADMCSP